MGQITNWGIHASNYQALPGKHTEMRSRIEVALLCQLRSGMCRLNRYLTKIGAVETDMNECDRESESEDQCIFRCPQWLEQPPDSF